MVARSTGGASEGAAKDAAAGAAIADAAALLVAGFRCCSVAKTATVAITATTAAPISSVAARLRPALSGAIGGIDRAEGGVPVCTGAELEGGYGYGYGYGQPEGGTPTRIARQRLEFTPQRAEGQGHQMYGFIRSSTTRISTPDLFASRLTS